jgi:hypothetical protein
MEYSTVHTACGMVRGGEELIPSALPRTEGFSVLLNCPIAEDHKGAILNDDSVIDLFTNKGV